MPRARALLRSLTIHAVVLTIATGAAIAGTRSINIDRRFPVFQFCPLDHLDFDLTFVAEGPSATITIVANNFTSDPTVDPNDRWNEQIIDNIAVTEKAVFDAHLLVTPGYDLCYVAPGDENTPCFDFSAPGTPEVFLDLFDTGAGSWDLTRGAYHFAGSAAPRDPASGLDTSGGALGLGQQGDGAVQVATSITVSGLALNKRYVLSGWWSTRNRDLLSITVDPAGSCADEDGDTVTDCQPDCNDFDPSIWARPGEVPDLSLTHDRATGTTTLTWARPPDPGATSVLYDTIVSPSPADFVIGASCLETNDGSDTSSTDLATPIPGTVFNYLIRAENSCINGQGSLGTDSSGVPRAGRDCSPVPPCSHDKCTTGAPLQPSCESCIANICAVDPACCSVAWDSTCVDKVRTVCGSLVCPANQGICQHHMCVPGGPLFFGCDEPPVTPSCVSAICGFDSFCCNVGWDDLCVGEVGSICGYSCF